MDAKCSMAKRRWDSCHPDTLYGDAAARVMARMLGAEPTGRNLQQCLESFPIASSSSEALENGLGGDCFLTLSSGQRVGVECKASLNGTANVCWDPWERSRSSVGVLAAWVPGTDEICWFATVDEAQLASIWLERNDTWLVCRDRLT